MIDAENELYSGLYTSFMTAYTTGYISSNPDAVPESFPAVLFAEMDNSTYAPTLDSSGVENHATVMFQAQAISNAATGKKAQCKAIMALIDTYCFGKGLVRVGCSPITMSNEDATKYSMISRYRGVISKDKIIYRR